MHVHLERVRIADDQDAVAERLERRDELVRLEPGALDDEVRAVAERRARVLGVGDPGGGVVLELGRRLAAQRGDDAGEDQRRGVAAGVDDARVAQDGQQLRGPLDRRLARRDRRLEDRRDGRVLDLGRRVG